ncbi:MAG: glutamate formimidoyltransferase [Nitrospiraceae bacterium]|nr:glutamate formimidoyltransferase [Nitrospiraceae bacterium]
MNRIVECIPNFSEGRNPATIQALISAVTSVPDVWLLHYTMDTDHHRSVLTFAGLPDAVGEAALRAIRTATRLINLKDHVGEHPRVGATDVVPVVPVEGVTMEECVQLARRIGQEAGSELGLPVFLYEDAATHPHHIRLEAIRHGELRGLGARMESDPSWWPDFGPRRLHETAGAIVIGARRPLVAFNVNLKTTDLAIATAIAKTIRQSNGGRPCLKAIGVRLASRGMVQVAMNLTDYHVTPMHVAFAAVHTEAAKFGVDVAGSELIGLVAQEALDQTGVAALQLERFDPSQILDASIRAAISGSVRSTTSLVDFRTAVASMKPVPAGASVAAYVGALAASLGLMGARLAHRTEAEPRLLEMSERLHALVLADVEAYESVARARKISKERPERADDVEAAMQRATETPMEIAELSCEAGLLISTCRPSAKPAVQSDLTVGVIMAVAATEAGLHTVKENIGMLKNQEVKEDFASRVKKTCRSLEELKGLC